MTDNEKLDDTAQSEAEQVKEAAAKLIEKAIAEAEERGWTSAEKALAEYFVAAIRAMPLPTTDKERVLREAWQTIETAPKDGSYILGFGPHEARKTYMDVIHFWRDRWTITWMEGYGEPTHWMPLPPPPALSTPTGDEA